MEKKFLVLLALFAEYSREDGDFRRVNASLVEMDKREFLWALMKLNTEGLIDGIQWPGTVESGADMVMEITRDRLTLTRDGVRKAAELVGDAEMRNTGLTNQIKIAGMMNDIGRRVLANFIWTRM